MRNRRWRLTSTPAEPATTCTIMAARLTLRSHRHLPMLVRSSWRIGRTLRKTPGLAGYARSCDLRGKTLWIVSAWTSRADLGRFDRSDLHTAAKATIRPVLLPATFAVWRSPASELPIRWVQVRRRIAAASLARP